MTASSEPTRVFVVDDHDVFRVGVTTLIDLQPDMSVVGDADSGRSAIGPIRDSRPDVVVTDLQMDNGDGVWLCHALEREPKPPKVVMLTTFGGDFDVFSCLQAGATGFLCKDAPRDVLIDAVRAVAAGRQVLAPEIATKLASVLRTEHLTGREREILELVAEGLGNKQIGYQLKITEGTVKTHLNHMMSKLGVSGRTEAVVTAVRRGIIRL